MAKPTHIKAIAELLQSDEYETPLEMAKAILIKADELRSDDMTFMTVRESVHEDGSAYFGTGPYATFAQAQKAIERQRAGLAFAGTVAIVPVFHPKRIERSWERADSFPERHEGHWAHFRERMGVV